MMVMMSVLQKELFVSKVDGECTNSNTKTRESSLESVQTAKLALVSPGVSLGPGV
jgi:hypothetical protein